MKKIFTLIAFAMYVSAGFAQNNDGVDPKFASYMIETERRTVFVQNMNLSDTDAKIFWEIFDQFEAELIPLREKGINTLKTYAEQYEKITDEQAATIEKGILANQAKRVKIRKKYFNKMNKALGGKIATRFMQLDNIIAMVLRLSIYDEIPLVGDMN